MAGKQLNCLFVVAFCYVFACVSFLSLFSFKELVLYSCDFGEKDMAE